MQQVWTSSQSGGADRLVLLAIADNASDDGTDAWPSIDTLARKAHISSRTVQRCIDRLEALGELKVDRNAGGNLNTQSNRRPNRYSIILGCQSVTPDPVRGDTRVTPNDGLGVTSATVRGDTGVTLTVLEPKKTPPACAPAREAPPVDNSASGEAPKSDTPQPAPVDTTDGEARRALTRVADGMPADLAARLRTSPHARHVIAAAAAAVASGWTPRQLADAAGGSWDGIRDPARTLQRRIEQLGDPPARNHPPPLDAAAADAADAAAAAATAEPAAARPWRDTIRHRLRDKPTPADRDREPAR